MLFVTGILFLGVAGLNLFLNIPEQIQEYVFQRHINAPLSPPKSDVDVYTQPNQQSSPDSDSFTKKSVLRQELVTLKYKIRAKTPFNRSR